MNSVTKRQKNISNSAAVGHRIIAKSTLLLDCFLNIGHSTWMERSNPISTRNTCICPFLVPPTTTRRIPTSFTIGERTTMSRFQTVTTLLGKPLVMYGNNYPWVSIGGLPNFGPDASASGICCVIEAGRMMTSVLFAPPIMRNLLTF